MEPRQDPRHQLGEDLWALACSVGQEPLRATLVTPLPTGGVGGSLQGRAAFRVEYPDGLQLKARRHRDLGTAERVLKLRSFIDSRHLPSMVANQGRCHLTAWVQGESPSPDDKVALYEAGAFLGKLHATAVASEIHRYGFLYGDWEGRNQRNALQLVDAGALTSAQGKALLARLTLLAPPDSKWTIIQADLAPENVVMGESGGLLLVDNENLSVDAPGFDLARTWYRWPITESRPAPFLKGYRGFADPEPFLAFSGFWTMSVLMEASRFRVVGNTPDASVPLEPLRRWIAGSGKVPGLD